MSFCLVKIEIQIITHHLISVMAKWTPLNILSLSEGSSSFITSENIVYIIL